MDRDERRMFVREHRTCVLGYARQQHGPAMTVVYYVTDGDDILVSTMAARSKAKAVDRDPQVSLCVLGEPALVITSSSGTDGPRDQRSGDGAV